MNRVVVVVAVLVTVLAGRALHADESVLAWESFTGGRPPAQPPFACTSGGAPAPIAPGPDRGAESWSARAEEPGVRRAIQSSAIGPAGGIRAEIRYAVYPDFTAVEWLPWLSNDGATDSSVLSDLASGDFTLPAATAFDSVLHHAEGSSAKASDFQPLRTTLTRGQPKIVRSQGGRSSDGFLPYFNVRLGETRGAIVAVGWTGDWRAGFERTDAGVRVRVGLARGHFFLRPNESVRLPSVIVMFYEGDRLDGQNRWRRFVRGHLTPAAAKDGAALPVAASPHLMVGFNDQSEANMLPIVETLRRARLPVDTYWIDAGWNAGGFPAKQGNFDPDPHRYPRGLRPVSDAAHDAGLKFVLWFEPERVMPATWMAEHHPEWLLAPDGLPPELQYQADWRLLDLGNPAAREWAIDTLARQIADWRVDVYRQDFNMHPAFYWAAGEPADRQGLREIRHIMGLYELFDALRAKFPDLLIDNCASGGRRMDFEMMRRSVVLWRSDHCWDQPEYPASMQAAHYGLSLWHPFTGVGTTSPEPVPFRTGLGAHISLPLKYDDPDVVEAARTRLTEYLPLRRHFAADFHPLTEHTLADSDWIGWQYHAPDVGEGLVQLFRRAQAPSNSIEVRLRGLDPAARYRLTSDGRTEEQTGAALMNGWTVRAESAPAAVIVEYSKVSESR